MTRPRSSRAASCNNNSANQSQAQTRSVKRSRGSESPVYLASCALVSPEEAKQARQRFFNELENGNDFPGMKKAISTADHLTEVQLKKCFDILHACGSATDDRATLGTTRASIDGFLDAVFNEWTSDKDFDVPKPDLDFLVEAEVAAGRVCGKILALMLANSLRVQYLCENESMAQLTCGWIIVSPSQHHDTAACLASDVCTSFVTAVATYSCNPAMLKLEFTMVDPFTRQPEAFCPINRKDIRWDSSPWCQTLQQTLEGKIMSRIHKYNKHLAVWHARKLIRDWSKGDVSLGLGIDDIGFLDRDTASVVLLGLGGRSLGPRIRGDELVRGRP